jgi:hypothetical protein
MNKLIRAALLFVAGPTLAQEAGQPTPVSLPRPIARDIARTISAGGTVCPEIRTAYHVGSDDAGNILRVMCGHINGAAIETPTFRVHIGHYGNTRVSRWDK